MKTFAVDVENIQRIRRQKFDTQSENFDNCVTYVLNSKTERQVKSFLALVVDVIFD